MNSRKHFIYLNLILIVILLLFLSIGCKKISRPNEKEENNKYYTIKYVLDSSIDPILVDIELAKTTTLEIYPREGYTFKGWYKDEVYTDGPYETYKSDIEKTIIFYAKWENDEIINTISAKLVIDMINEIPQDITINDEELINSAIVAYNNLIDNAKVKVTNYQKLLDNKNSIDEIIRQINDYITIYNSLPSSFKYEDELTLYEEAKALYDNLPRSSKKYVNNFSSILIYEINYNNFKKGIEKARQVVKMINDLPNNITLSNQDTIKEIRKNYTWLDDSFECYVENIDKLNRAETELKYLLDSTPEGIDKLIKALSINTTYNDYHKVVYINGLYDNLTEEKKQDVTTISRLREVEEKLSEIVNDTSFITYVLGDNVYESKQALFEAFFSDFYYFIKQCYGDEALNEKGITSISDFLVLASDYNAGRGSMRAIGDNFGEYLLIKDLNGIKNDQPVDKFIGYCVDNNLYEEFIPFLINMFAYWRLDEKYANKNNYGADFFAESWAPTVDIAKFFYYDTNTSYVKTYRMIDYLTHIEGVVYGSLPKTCETGTRLPNNLSRRGYNFIGFYDNPEFSGEPITVIEDTSKKIILYAKWEENKYSKDYDAAALVDTYIYNLTTSLADVSKENIQKVKDMYNALSDNGKLMVYEYDTLIDIELNLAEELPNPLTITFNLNKPIVFTSFNDMKESFLNDFNECNGTNLTNYSTFISNQYTVMKQLVNMFTNDEMYTKWIFIIQYFLNQDNIGTGLMIQSKRMINRQNGDLEYVANALAGFFNETNMLNNKDVKIDFTNVTLIITDQDKQNELEITYTTITKLPVLNITDYLFLGYATNPNGTGEIYEYISEDIPTMLYAIYTKINLYTGETK